MSKTINQLSDLYDVLHDHQNPPTLKDIYRNTSISGSWNTLFSELFTENDCFAVSHEHGTDQFITYKLPISTFEAVMHKLRKCAMSAEISSALDLKDLAWKDYSELNLNTLAHRKYVSWEDIVSRENKNSTEDVVNHEKVIPLKSIDTVWGNLHSKNESDLKLSGLAHQDKIVNGDVDLNNKLDIKTSLKGYGKLALSNEVDLKLSALAHKSSIDLDTDYNRHLTGKLSFSNIKDYTPYELSVAKTDKLGGVKLGYSRNNTNNYPLSVDAQSKAYVSVPWTDTQVELTSLSASADRNKISISLKCANKTKTPEHPFPSPTTQELTASATISAYIFNNVVGDANIPYNTIDNYIPLFSGNNSSDAIHLKRSGIKIDTAKADSQRYLREDGTWTVISAATQQNDGLLSKADKKILDDLQNNQYSLPAATASRLGGIKLYSSDNAQGSWRLYPNESVVSLPVRLNTVNQAYVNIPSSIGDTQDFAKKVSESVDGKLAAMLNSLYPVGAIYITAAETCPLSSLIPNSVWTKIEGRYLLASGQLAGGTAKEVFSAGSNVDAGFPTHSHDFSFGFSSSSSTSGYPHHGGGSQCNHSSHDFTTGSVSGTFYGKSKTIRPAAFAVNVFRRTA